ncbi:thioredoxin-like protein [Mycena leptocephala]|nr:thioredoxin-like protein [Mycena leptocephala]
MVLKLYATSFAAGGGSIVALVLAEKQIPFELVLVDLAAKEQKLPEFLAKNPWGKVPVIDDDGFILYESRAICRLKERALVEQAASLELANFHPAVIKVAAEVFSKPRQGLTPDQALLDAGLADLSAKLDVYEEFTLADLFHMSTAPKGPNVTRWWNELMSRPAWVKIRAEGVKGSVN